MRARQSRVAAALAVGLVLLSASCSSPTAVPVEPAAVAKTATGGTLHILRQGPVSGWDPQRLSVGADIAFAGRVFQRTLTAWGPATHQDRMPSLSADLATDTGTVGSAGKVWTFTLRRGVKWQDGRSVTCADVKYGVSRTFATASIAGGSTQALALLDVPRKADGTSTYAGPYLKTGQGGFDKAVSCSGQTLTVRLVVPVLDFNQVVALAAFAPVRADKDRGAQPGVPATSDIFSNGPYQLKGAWLPGKGGTFVRNPHWDVRTDPIRKARPAELVYTDGVPVEDIVSRIMTNQRSDSLAVSAESAPQVLQNNIMANPSIRARSSNPLGQYVDYLLPNFKRPIMNRLKVRQALAMATSREAYVAGLGGDTAAVATHAMISQALPAYRAINPLKVPPRGDSARARALLLASGLVLPVSVTVAYRKGATADKAMAALRQGWEDAGFSVTLVGIEKDYLETIASVQKSRGFDVMWAVGSAQWPSGSSVIPALFDSRLNLTATSSGQDYGRFADAAFSARVDAAAKIPDASRRERAWADLDQELATRVAAIPLTNSRSVFVHGSGVVGYVDNQALFGTVDLATVAVR